MYCEYYQAIILRKKTWFLSGSFRNESNLAFERSLDSKNNLFEFFVPKDREEYFLNIIHALQKKGIVLFFEKKPNRLK